MTNQKASLDNSSIGLPRQDDIKEEIKEEKHSTIKTSSELKS